ncbi:MAG: hypothetical protein KY396_06310 [Actinobacteria bacterium]|nr:hypothetical protein [Actinomycetota bacterium]
MRAFKFLARGSVGRFSDFRWPLPSADEPGAWVHTADRLENCRHGVHACRGHQVLPWIDDELWAIELRGEILDQSDMLIAESGRLLTRVEGWDARAATEFAEACAWRSRDYALRALRRVGLTDEANRLVEAASLGEMQAAAASAARTSGGAARELTGFAADTVSLTHGERPDAWAAPSRPRLRAPEQTPGAVAANLAHVVAHAAGREAVAAGRTYEQGYDEERAWQLEWLEKRLSVSLGA